MSDGGVSNWSVRPAIEADLADLARLHAECFADAWPVDDWRRHLSETTHTLLAIRANHDRSGPLAGGLLARRIADEAEILTIFVAKPYRRQGLGRQLMSSLIDELKGEVPCRLFLEVAVSNTEAIKLYSDLGFMTVGMRKGYYRVAGHAPLDAKLLALDLRN